MKQNKTKDHFLIVSTVIDSLDVECKVKGIRYTRQIYCCNQDNLCDIRFAVLRSTFKGKKLLQIRAKSFLLM